MLELGADIQSDGNHSESPRYISVSKVCPNNAESEQLFSGKVGRFRIRDIFKDGMGHRNEVAVLRKIDRILHNEITEWTDEELAVFMEYCSQNERAYVHKYCMLCP